MHHITHDAYETFETPGPGKLFVTCEHASNRVPAPLRTNAVDRVWLNSHWGYDIGARTLSLELIRALGGNGVLARFSRLVVDANREPWHRDLIRVATEGHRLSFNEQLAPAEIERRVQRFHEPYHAAVDAGLRSRLESEEGDVLLLSVHTFTPVWNHRVRPMDVGVLFSDYEGLAVRLATELRADGLDTALNEPYSGRQGLIYAAERHGSGLNVVFLELEVNQSLTCTPGRARRVGRRIAAALNRLRLREHRRAASR